MPLVNTPRSLLPSIYISSRHVLSIYIITCFVLFSSVNSELQQKFNISKELEVDDHHLFGLSSDSLISNQIQRNQTAKGHLKRLVQLFQTYAHVISKRRIQNAPDACLGPPKKYSDDSRWASKIKQIGILSESCDTTLFANKAAKNNELDYQKDVASVRQILTETNKAVFNAARKISVIPPTMDSKLNWTRGAFRSANWDLQEEGQKCSLERSFGHRINGDWYIRVEMTNAPVDVTLEYFNRQYIAEFVRDDSGPSLSTVYVAYDGSTAGTNGTLVNATTILERWSGRVGLSTIGSFSFPDIAALNEAHSDNAIAVDLASDAITASNIAILALPMAMSIIPLAFIADLNSAATVAYLIFTDIFSVLPLMIKGVELIKAAKAQEAVFAIQLGDEELLQMEIFWAECSGIDTYRKWGIIFIVTSTSAIVIGVALELIADHIMTKRRNKMGDTVTGPFGMATFGFTKVSILGRIGADGIRVMKDLIQRNSSDSISSYKSKLSDEELKIRYTSEKDRRYSVEELLFMTDVTEE